MTIETFGNKLRYHRYGTRDPFTKKPLTQARFAEYISLCVGLELDGKWISYVERSHRFIDHNDRHILVGIICVLHHRGGIHSLLEANQLLYAGNYRRLNDKEIALIKPIWIYTSTSYVSACACRF